MRLHRHIIVTSLILLTGVCHTSPLNWTPPALLQNQNSVYYPSPVSDGHGKWMSTWYSFHPSTNGGAGTLYISTSVDGNVWSAPKSLTYGSYFPKLATDRKGKYIVAYQGSFHYYAGAIQTSTDFGTNWTNAQIVSGPQDGHASVSDIATDGKGTWMVTGVKGTGTSSSGRYWIAISTDDGTTWNWTDRGAGHAFGISTDSKGRWMLSWAGGSYPNSTVNVAFSTDKGATWSAPTNLGNMVIVDGGSGTGTSEAASGSYGTWAVAWATGSAIPGSGSDQDIIIRRTTDDGATWHPAQLINKYGSVDSFHDYNPSLLPDGRGNWIATWFSRGSQDGSTGSDPDIVYSTSTDNAATWNEPHALNSDASTDSTADNFPVLATDGLGTWLCHWMKYSYTKNYQGMGSRTQFEAPQVRIVSPFDDKCVAGNRVLLKADITPYSYWPLAGSMTFEYRTEPSSEWLIVPAAESNHPNPDPNAPYFTHWDVTSLPEGPYELRASVTFASTATVYSPVIKVNVASNCSNGQRLEGGTTEAWVETDRTTQTVLAAADCTSSRSIQLNASAGALPDGTIIQASFPAVSAGTMSASSVGISFMEPVQVTFGDQTAASSPIELSIDYQDLLQDGIVDGSATLESELVLYRLGSTSWEPIASSSVNVVRNSVSALITQPGTYAISTLTASRVEMWELY